MTRSQRIRCVALIALAALAGCTSHQEHAFAVTADRGMLVEIEPGSSRADGRVGVAIRNDGPGTVEVVHTDEPTRVRLGRGGAMNFQHERRGGGVGATASGFMIELVEGDVANVEIRGSTRGNWTMVVREE